VQVLERALGAWYSGDAAPLAEYTATALRRVWRVQWFSWWMTSMLHRFPDSAQDTGDFDLRRQIAELQLVTSSEAVARTLAEHYVGTPPGV
jgi:p-hydroxybenzoate 3-monooxygenase